MSSSNWQSFRNFCEEPQRAKMVPTVARITRRRREMGFYYAGSRVKRPKSYAKRSKNAQICDRPAALVGVQHHDWHMGKKTVSARLLQALTPIRNLKFKSSQRVIHAGNKIAESGVAQYARVFPSHRNQVRDSVSISRDFTSKRHLFPMVVIGKRIEASPVRPGKVKRKAVLCAFPRVELREISLRLMACRFPNWLFFHSLDSFRAPEPTDSAGFGLSCQPGIKASMRNHLATGNVHELLPVAKEKLLCARCAHVPAGNDHPGYSFERATVYAGHHFRPSLRYLISMEMPVPGLKASAILGSPSKTFQTGKP